MKYSHNIDFMKEKCIHSFLLAIEVYNKPTIPYRLEGCLFFLCNAWELLLKAYLISKLGNESIYYKGRKQTLSLKDTAKLIMTNDKDPIRKNLDIIISQRNMATHFVIPEYEQIMVPFLAFNTKAFADKLQEYFSININDYITSDFLSLFSLNDNKNVLNIIHKYGEEADEMFKKTEAYLNEMVESSGDNSIASRIEINLVRVNKENYADLKFYASNNPNEQNVKYIERHVDYNTTHKLNHRGVKNLIDQAIKKNNIQYTPLRTPEPTDKNPNPDIFTTAALDFLLREYKLKDNLEYCVKLENGNTIVYKYSQKIVTYIISLIQEDSNIVVNIRNKKS